MSRLKGKLAQEELGSTLLRGVGGLTRMIDR